MSNQGRIEPFEPSDAFPFDQSARPAVDGVVSRQEEPELTWLETVRQDEELV